jgi:hypothetical protein
MMLRENPVHFIFLVGASMVLPRMRSLAGGGNCCLFRAQRLRAQGIHYTFVLCRRTGHKPLNELPLSVGPFKLISTLNPR